MMNQEQHAIPLSIKLDAIWKELHDDDKRLAGRLERIAAVPDNGDIPMTLHKNVVAELLIDFRSILDRMKLWNSLAQQAAFEAEKQEKKS